MLRLRIITAVVLLAVLLPALFAASPWPFSALALVMIGGGRFAPSLDMTWRAQHEPIRDRVRRGAGKPAALLRAGERLPIPRKG